MITVSDYVLNKVEDWIEVERLIPLFSGHSNRFTLLVLDKAGRKRGEVTVEVSGGNGLDTVHYWVNAERHVIGSSEHGPSSPGGVYVRLGDPEKMATFRRHVAEGLAEVL